MESQGRLACVGVGMMLGAHLSPRSRSHIQQADVVFAAVSDPLVELWVKEMNADVRSLQPFYQAGKARTETYREMVEAMLAEVGLTEAQFPRLLSRYPHEFSGGQRQRLAMARALIVEPQVLVLDEPTSALDVTIQQQVLGLLQRLQKEKGLSYLLITHDVDVIRAMAHDVVVMKDGAVLEGGSVNDVLDAPQHPYTQRLVAAATVPGIG